MPDHSNKTKQKEQVLRRRLKKFGLHNLHKSNAITLPCGLGQGLALLREKWGGFWAGKGLPVTMHLTVFGMTIKKKNNVQSKFSATLQNFGDARSNRLLSPSPFQFLNPESSAKNK